MSETTRLFDQRFQRAADKPKTPWDQIAVLAERFSNSWMILASVSPSTEQPIKIWGLNLWFGPLAEAVCANSRREALSSAGSNSCVAEGESCPRSSRASLI